MKGLYTAMQTAHEERIYLDGEVQAHTTPVFDPASISDPYLRLAVETHSASFSHVGYAHFHSPQDEYQVARVFQEEHGTISRINFCDGNKVGVVSTDTGEVFVYCHSEATIDNPEIEECMYRCQMLHYEAVRFLGKSRDLKACTENTYSILLHLLGLIESPLSDESGSSSQIIRIDNQKALLSFIRKELGRAKQYFQDAAQRIAQARYFAGMLAGLLLVTLMCTALWFMVAHAGLINQTKLFSQEGPKATEWQIQESIIVIGIAGSFVAGALGAMISVLSRLSSGKCVLDYKAGQLMLCLIGVFRPILGAVFGALSFILLQAGLFSLGTMPAAPASRSLFFFWSVAFIAGFSERWAQDMLNMAVNKIYPMDGDKNVLQTAVSSRDAVTRDIAREGELARVPRRP